MEKQFFVYMLASRKEGVLYVGVTSDLRQRIWQHRQSLPGSFSHRYNVKSLVWFEAVMNAESAISREKQIKGWRRAWKIELIQRVNPEWRDLYADICG